MNRRHPKSFYFRARRGERLEPRNMLAGHPIAALFSPAAFGFHPAFRESSGVFGSHSAGTQSSSEQQTVLTASLTDPNSSATGTVSYQTGGGCGGTATTLSVSVTGAAASSTLSVAIGGTTVGTVTTDSTGAGTLVLSSNPKGSQQSLPTNFPTSIAAGTAVTVGSLSGTFAASTSTTGSAGSSGSTGTSGGCGVSQATTLIASLADPNGSTAAGTVKYTTGTSYGTTTTKLTVTVIGATASTTLSVTIGGVTAGTLTTDNTGAGTLVLSSNPTGNEQALPSNFPTSITSGATVTLGTLSGTFATSTSGTTIRIHRHH